MMKYKDLINSIEIGELEHPLTREEFGETIGVDIKKEWKKDSNWNYIDHDTQSVIIAIPTHYINEGVEVVLTLKVSKGDHITHIQDVSEY